MTEPSPAHSPEPNQSAASKPSVPDLSGAVAAVMQSPDFAAYLTMLETAAADHATEHLGAAGPLAAFLGKAFLAYALQHLFRS